MEKEEDSSKFLELLKKKNEEIARLKEENDGIKDLENEIMKKLQQTEIMLEATEIANRQKIQNEELTQLEEERSELKSIQILHQREIFQLREENRVLKEEMLKLKKNLSSVQTKEKKLRKSKGKKIEILELEKRKLASENAALVEERVKFEAQNKQLVKKLRRQASEASRKVERERKLLNDEISRLREEKEMLLEKTNQGGSRSPGKYLARIQVLNQEKTRLNKTMEALRKDHADKVMRVEQLEKEVDEKEAKKDRLFRKLNVTKNKMSQLDGEKKEMSSKNELLLKQKEEQFNALKRTNDENIHKLVTLNVENQDLHNEIRLKNQVIDKMTTQISDLLTRDISGEKGDRGTFRFSSREHGGRKDDAYELRIAQIVKEKVEVEEKLLKSLENENRLRKEVIEREKKSSQSGTKRRGGVVKKKKKPVLERKVLELEIRNKELLNELNKWKMKKMSTGAGVGGLYGADPFRFPEKIAEEAKKNYESKLSEVRGKLLGEAETKYRRLASQSAAMERDLMSKVNSLASQKEKLTTSYTKMKITMEKQAQIIGKFKKMNLEGRSERVVNRKTVEELKETKAVAESQARIARAELEEARKNFQRTCNEKDKSLKVAVKNLQKESGNVQRLMRLITSLRERNEKLLKCEKENVELKEKVGTFLKNNELVAQMKIEFEKKLNEAKEFIKNLSQERTMLKSSLKKANMETNEAKEQLEEEVKGLEEMIREKEKNVKTAEGKLRSAESKFLEEMEKERKKISTFFEQKENEKREYVKKNEIERKKLEERSNILALENTKLTKKVQVMKRRFDVYQEEKEFERANIEKTCRSLHQKVSNYIVLERSLKELSGEKKELGKRIREMEKELQAKGDIEVQVKNQKRKFSKERKKLLDDKANLKKIISQLKENTRTLEEFEVIENGLKNAKKALSRTIDENNRKNEVIQRMRKEYEEEMRGMKENAVEKSGNTEKYKKLLKESTKKSKMIREYQDRIGKMKEEIGMLKKEKEKLKKRSKSQVGEFNRKNKFVKNLQKIIDDKNKFIEDLKGEMKEKGEVIEKKEVLLRTNLTKINRLEKTSKLKNRENSGKIRTMRGVILKMAGDQIRQIEKLERNMQSFQVQKRRESDLAQRVGNNTSINTTGILDASRATITHDELGLSFDEMHDILRTTRQVDERGNMDEEQSEKLKQAKKLMFVLQKHIESFDNVEELNSILQNLFNLRVEMEVNNTVLVSKSSQSFMSRGGKKRDDNLLFQDEVDQMRMRERHYERTIKDLENEILRE